MSSSGAGGASVVVTYTVSPAPTTTIPLAPPSPAPAVTHQPLPLTGAPVTFELMGSFGLLIAGAIAAYSAHRQSSRRPTGADRRP